MAIIKMLDKDISELIAAGEVVERPTSIVKELVENCIDAGATRVIVEIQNGGITFIRVTDNGSGILREDIPNAFIRHATSKIYTREDLENIGTMGFRGEALPSIAAMSRVEVLTRVATEITGNRYCIEGMVEVENTEAGCPIGTTIVVKNLFYNTPARMKFLKKDSVEGSSIAGLLDKLALANPHIAFTFIRDGVTKLVTPGDNQLLSVIRIIYSGEVSSAMIKVAHQVGDIRVVGYIGKPSYAKPTRALQHFFINDRFVNSKTCTAALEEAYKTRLMGGRFPVCALKVYLPFSAVDVNVHPAKTEVRFSDEKSVYNGVYSSCRLFLDKEENSVFAIPAKSKLTQFSLDDIDYSKKQLVLPNTSVAKSTMSQNTNKYSLHSPNTNIAIHGKKPDVFAPSSQATSNHKFSDPNKPKMSKFQSADVNISAKNAPKIAEKHDFNTRLSPEIPEILDLSSPNIVIIGEIFKSFIICQVEDSMVLIDKHAAHERYIYRQLKSLINAKERQLVLTNAIVSLTIDEYTTILDNLDTLENLGIIAEDFGGKCLIIREVAMVLEGISYKSLLSDIATKLNTQCNDLTPEALDKLLFSVACRCAVMSGTKSTAQELLQLAQIALEKDGAKYCPHGRPTTMHYKQHEIQRLFGRLS